MTKNMSHSQYFKYNTAATSSFPTQEFLLEKLFSLLFVITMQDIQWSRWISHRKIHTTRTIFLRYHTIPYRLRRRNTIQFWQSINPRQHQLLSQTYHNTVNTSIQPSTIIPTILVNTWLTVLINITTLLQQLSLQNTNHDQISTTFHGFFFVLQI